MVPQKKPAVVAAIYDKFNSAKSTGHLQVEVRQKDKARQGGRNQFMKSLTFFVKSTYLSSIETHNNMYFGIIILAE